MIVKLNVIRKGRIVSQKNIEVKTHPKGTRADKDVNPVETAMISRADRFYPATKHPIH